MSLLNSLVCVGVLSGGDGESRKVVDGWACGLGGRVDGERVVCGMWMIGAGSGEAGLVGGGTVG